MGRARSILARRGGVLLADSVGLGKTHIAAALLENCLDDGGRAAIVSPAGLRRQWREATAGPNQPDWMSYGRLSRGHGTAARYDIVVFDEAHALRNPSTRRYRAAHSMANGARVLLLTATPVNNSLWDLYHLLRLFCGERHFLDAGVPSLRGAFEEAASYALLGSAPSLQPVLRAVMVRRTRTIARAGATDEAERARLIFPSHRPPAPVRYRLGPDDHRDILGRVGDGLLRLSFPAHSRTRAGEARGSGAPDALMRLSLLKRLESSVHAFHRSIVAYDDLLNRCEEGLANGVLVRARDAETGGDAAQLRLDALLFEPLPANFSSHDYAEQLAAERAALCEMRDVIRPALASDGKLAELWKLLDGDLRGHRVLVFTQFRDTARYLHDRLCRRARVGLIDGSGARLGAESADRLTVIRSFAPLANGAPIPGPHQKLDILVATDVLSEGFNLQDADVVVSYDLPWNPIRLVQRIGRVDRLGSRHASVASYHFLPGELERYLGLLDRIARKAMVIDATVGSDIPTLHAVLARGLDRRDAEVLARVDQHDAEWFDLDEGLQGLLSSAGGSSPRADVASTCFAVGALPVRCVAGGAKPTGLVAARVGARFEWVAVVRGRPVSDDRACGRMIEAAMAAATESDRAGCVPAQALAELLDTARRELARRAAIMSSAPLLPAGGARARLGRRVLGLASGLPGGPDVDMCARIERCLAGIARMSDEGVARLDAIADIPTGGSEAGAHALSAILRRIEGRMGGAPPTRSSDSAAGEGLPVRLIGALLHSVD